jgi:hypothetical protein
VPWRSEESLVPHTLLERCGLNLRAPIVDIVNIYSDLRRREREGGNEREEIVINSGENRRVAQSLHLGC